MTRDEDPGRPRLLDAAGNEVGPLAQRDAFPGVRIASVLEAATTIAELRAVLAPLLDDEGWAFHHSAPAGAYGIAECVFCGAACGDYGQPPLTHAPDCPVLRKDALLGR
jgi:hypothetical protein